MPNTLAGKRVKCKKCGQGVFVGKPSPVSANTAAKVEVHAEVPARKENMEAAARPGVEPKSSEELRVVERKIGEDRRNAEKNEEDGRRVSDGGMKEAEHVDARRLVEENAMKQGTSAPPNRFCANCGKPMDVGDMFCGFCGHSACAPKISGQDSVVGKLGEASRVSRVETIKWLIFALGVGIVFLVLAILAMSVKVYDAYGRASGAYGW